MGQTYSTGTGADPTVRWGPLEAPDLADITYDKTIGTSRFLKTVRGKHLGGGLVVIKVYHRPLAGPPLNKYKKLIERVYLCPV